MFCKFGSVELILPVAVIVWWKNECILLVLGFIYGFIPSTYVELSFINCLYSNIFSIIGCSSFNFSNTSTSVEYPLLVFFTTVNFNFSNKTSPNCLVEFILNSSPANSYISCVKISSLSFNCLPYSSSSCKSTYIPFHCISDNTSTVGISIFLNNSTASISCNFFIVISASL